MGIGRPSTYASTISRIIKVGYVTRNKGTLIPTFTGFAVVKFLEKYFEQLINLEFTEGMEDDFKRYTKDYSDLIPESADKRDVSMKEILMSGEIKEGSDLERRLNPTK